MLGQHGLILHLRLDLVLSGLVLDDLVLDDLQRLAAHGEAARLLLAQLGGVDDLDGLVVRPGSGHPRENGLAGDAADDLGVSDLLGDDGCPEQNREGVVVVLGKEEPRRGGAAVVGDARGEEDRFPGVAPCAPVIVHAQELGLVHGEVEPLDWRKFDVET